MGTKIDILMHNLKMVIILIGLIASSIIYALHITTNIGGNYSALAILSSTLFGFFITSFSVLLLVFERSDNEMSPLIKIMKHAKSYPDIYKYYLFTIFLLGTSIAIFTFFWLTGFYGLSIIVSNAITSFLLIEITLFSAVSMILLDIIIKNLVVKREQL